MSKLLNFLKIFDPVVTVRTGSVSEDEKEEEGREGERRRSEERSSLFPTSCSSGLKRPYGNGPKRPPGGRKRPAVDFDRFHTVVLDRLKKLFHF